jgi:hypothetical protein
MARRTAISGNNVARKCFTEAVVLERIKHPTALSLAHRG